MRLHGGLLVLHREHDDFLLQGVVAAGRFERVKSRFQRVEAHFESLVGCDGLIFLDF